MTTRCLKDSFGRHQIPLHQEDLYLLLPVDSKTFPSSCRLYQKTSPSKDNEIGSSTCNSSRTTRNDIG